MLRRCGVKLIGNWYDCHCVRGGVRAAEAVFFFNDTATTEIYTE